jgi:hypothetical protein
LTVSRLSADFRVEVRNNPDAPAFPGSDDALVQSVVARRRRARAARLAVHVALLVTVLLSLALEPVLTLHIAVGLVFVGFVVVHLMQRRRTSRRLLRSLSSHIPLASPTSRLAWSDLALGALTAVMLSSGLWDWLDGRTRIRWHAISGVVLTVVLAIHTVRRRRRLTRSAVN